MPYPGSSTLKVLSNVVSQDRKKVTEHNPNVPKELEEIVDKAMAGEIEERFQSAAEMIQALNAVKAKYKIGPLKAPVRLKTKRWLAGLAAAFLAAVIGAFFSGLRRPPSSSVLDIAKKGTPTSSKTPGENPVPLYSRALEKLQEGNRTRNVELIRSARDDIRKAIQIFDPYLTISYLDKAEYYLLQAKISAHLGRLDQAKTLLETLQRKLGEEIQRLRKRLDSLNELERETLERLERLKDKIEGLLNEANRFSAKPPLFFRVPLNSSYFFQHRFIIP